MLHLRLALLVTLFLPTAWGATARELLADLGPTLDSIERDSPGSTAWAEAIAELLAEDLGLPAPEVLELRLALAEAWVGAGTAGVDHATATAEAVLRDLKATPVQRQRAAAAWIAAWQEQARMSETPAELADPMVALAAFGDLGPVATARILTADAQRWMAAEKPEEALIRLDQAVAGLVDRPTEERVPIHVMRLLAMEARGDKPEQIQAWLAEHSKDPAIAQIAASALTAGQKLIGQVAPPFQFKRLDGGDGVVSLKAFAGKPVVLDFFATWCKPCEPHATHIAAVLAKFRDQVGAVGMSLDTRETLPSLPGFIAKHAIAYPVVGDGLGWDTEIDDAYHLDGIPALILVGADGRVAAVDLIGTTGEDTAAKLSAAIEAALRADAVAPGPGGGGLQGVLP